MVQNGTWIHRKQVGKTSGKKYCAAFNGDGIFLNNFLFSLLKMSFFHKAMFIILTGKLNIFARIVLKLPHSERDKKKPYAYCMHQPIWPDTLKYRAVESEFKILVYGNWGIFTLRIMELDLFILFLSIESGVRSWICWSAETIHPALKRLIPKI